MSERMSTTQFPLQLELDLKEEEQFKIHQQVFDKIAEKLSASRQLFAQIKHEYDQTITRIADNQQRRCSTTYREYLKRTEAGSISNYQRHCKQLKAKVEKAKAYNKRLICKLESMRKERATTSEEREYKIQLLKKQALETASVKRRSLRLSTGDSINMTQLQREFQKIKSELVEVTEITNKKYLSAQRKGHLQQQLKEKERLRSEIAAENKLLVGKLRKLRLAIKASDEYLAYLEGCHDTDTFQLSLMDLARSMSACQPADRDQLSEEDSEDPIKEMEAEMILDCFEKFNDLFENENFEEAALHAATSPKGVLRTFDTLSKFKQSARHQAGQKLPLLYYCEALVQCAPAYAQISLEESLPCIQCILENCDLRTIFHWISKDLVMAKDNIVPSSVELGTMLFNHCKCIQSCCCEYKSLAFTIFEKCGAYEQAALCLVHQGRYACFLSYARKRKLKDKVYAILLYNYPKAEFAHCLALPPSPHHSLLTPLEATQLLLSRQVMHEVEKFLKSYLQEYQRTKRIHDVVQDNKTNNWEMWQNLLDCLQRNQLDELALELFSVLTVKLSLAHAVEHLQLEYS